ncbi:hypothetical protein [Brevundimonas sp. Root1423]|uniref:hypothetical protein n=1 Tax=Brevundimonas sp. Root1423 TaxID=1736462 RepID=UPI0006F1E7CB|nr:hypothetical protein [Brevundimonas sp. Root1423]KQY89702.1 hypothetical protein ASD25_03905 [Brevundimonas sp. Root1423]
MTRKTAHMIFSGAAIAASINLAACQRPEPAEIASPDPEIAAPADPKPQSSPSVLGRAELLDAVAAAASDAAGGVARRGPSGIDGRQFRLRFAFGCHGEDPPPPDVDTDGDGVARWFRPAGGGNLRLSLSPADWSEGDPTGPAPPGFDGVEGVWIPFPWMKSERCPAPGLPMMDARTVKAEPRAGLAMLRAKDGSRLGRAGTDDFTHLVRGEAGAPAVAPGDGYRLVIEGRLTAWADGRVIRCRVIRSDEPPACVIGAAVDKVAFENAAGASLSEWRPG